MMPLRVLLISADRGIAPGSTKGAAQHLRGVAVGLSRRGHDVCTYSARPTEGSFPTAVNPLDTLGAVRSNVEPDPRTVVYERYSLGHRGGLELARRLAVPFVLEVNAPLVAEAARHRPDSIEESDSLIEAEVIAGADLVIAVSTELAFWVDSMRSGPTVVVSNGFEPGWFREPATPEQPEFPLVFIGHPKPWHGVDRLVDALVALAELDRHPDTLIIGGGPGADTLRRFARCAGVGTQVTITGALSPAEASSMLRRGGVGIAPYRRQDPFYFCPLKVIDYLAAGLPVVASDQGDVPRLVGDAGLVIDPDDDAALVDAVMALLDDPDARSDMGRRGRERAMASMTWDHVAAETEAAILAVMPTVGVRS